MYRNYGFVRYSPLVQRGTRHAWSNRTEKPCVVAFVLVAAKPVERAGKVLNATG